MNMTIVKQYAVNAVRVVVVLSVIAMSMLVGDKFQPFTYLRLTTNYLNQTEVKKTVVHNITPVAVHDNSVKTDAALAPEKQKDPRGEHIVTIKSEYVVRKGDTLWSIARDHNIHPEVLLFMNNMTHETKLRPGQRIVVSKN